MSDISQYLRDHANAGACADMYYNNNHDPSQCTTLPGVCSVIAYLIAELKNAEQRERMAVQTFPPPQYIAPAPVPMVPANPVTSFPQNNDVEKR